VRLLLAILSLVLASTAALAAPAMWEVRDADSRVLLFGSVHALPPDLDWRTPMFDAALAETDLVYFETDVGPLGMAALTIKVVIAQIQALQQPWIDRLTSEQLDKLIAALEPLDISLEQVAAAPPWLASMMIAEAAMRSDPAGGAMDMQSGVETVLQWELPKERKGYLETPGEQFDLIAGGTIDEQIQQLVLTIEEGGLDGGAVLSDLVDAWRVGDVDGLVIEPANAADAALIENLLIQRNRNWLPAIELMLKDNRENLIIVGAAHLAGDGDVLDLLEDAGYTITRIQ
jgi:uncharacterized protein YbaP (TraB family)